MKRVHFGLVALAMTLLHIGEPVLIEAVKQQQKQIEELKTRLKRQDVLQAQIEALKRRLDALQAL